MRLIVESAVERQLSQWKFFAGMQKLHGPLKSLNAAPGLG
jgi:hypothetical protein